MGELVVINNLTLDGVSQAPGRADEDPRGGFGHGGWAVPYSGDAMGRVMAGGVGRDGALLLGRRTYEGFASFWPRQPTNPFTEVLERMQKYVASRTLTGPLSWVNSTLLKQPVTQAIASLKLQTDGDLVVLGSGDLVTSLSRYGLVDEYVLLIHPLVLGSGRRLFPELGPPMEFELQSSTPTTTGVVIARYRPVSAPAQTDRTGKETP